MPAQVEYDDMAAALRARGCVCELRENAEKGRVEPVVRLPGCPVHVSHTARPLTGVLTAKG